MQAMRKGTLQTTDDQAITHINRCLGCRACETACPSGVAYGPALEETRHAIRASRPLGFPGTAALTVMAEPVLRAVVLGIARLIRPVARYLSGGGFLGFALGMLAATKPEKLRAFTKGQPPAVDPQQSGHGARTTVFRGCIMDGLFDHVNRATARVLTFNGFNVVNVPGQGCCGALHAHAGLMEQARSLARRNLAAFATAREADVVINSAGCGSALKEYALWFRGLPEEDEATAFAARVRDVTEVLVEVGPRPGAPMKLRVAYDPPCHLLHAQRIREAPLTVLRAVPELELVTHERADECCGSAGIYSLLERALSRDVLAPKIQALCDAEPDVVASGNPGCIMQIGAGLRAAGKGRGRGRGRIPVLHPVEILERSYLTGDGRD